jgi:tetratricopeptide (TPR) repeat protein
VQNATAGASAAELVREAHEHEAAHDEQVALRRYADALALDPTLGDAYLGMAALRLKLGDPREAERVYSVALAHVPSLTEAFAGRAEARRAQGQRATADADLESYLRAKETDLQALRRLATWYGEDGFVPAQLAAWRRIRAGALDKRDEGLTREATTMVKALALVVGSADPVTKPEGGDPTRRGLALMAKRAAR